jgi:hypothetical protein
MYDSQRDVYVVVNFPNHYYRDECYYREMRSGWEISVISVEGPWKPVAYDRLPPGLAKKIKKSHGHKHGRKW